MVGDRVVALARVAQEPSVSFKTDFDITYFCTNYSFTNNRLLMKDNLC